MMELLPCLLALALIFELIYVSAGVRGAFCPQKEELLTTTCSCYTFDEGLFVECEQGTPLDVNSYLKNVKYRIESLNINHLDSHVEEFPPDLLIGSQINFLHISNSEISSFPPGAFSGQENHIRALSILNSKMIDIPRDSIKSLKQLKVLDFSYNYIKEIPSYSFYDLSIEKLNLQNNLVESLLEYSFAGLDHSLVELSIANNRLEEFPLLALRRLRNLRILTITWNFIQKIRTDKHTKLVELKKLDIGYNKIVEIQQDIFASMPGLRSLSLSTNKIRSIDVEAFMSLENLEFLDLARNNIIKLEDNTFSHLQNIRTIDLSSNHLHTIENVLRNLPNLTELFLADNNIRHVDNGTFLDSTSITTLHLQDNAIEVLESSCLSGLTDLVQLQLSNNFIAEIPTPLFHNNTKLEMLSLDENEMKNLTPGTFDQLVNLRELRLQDNNIKYLQKGTFHLLNHLQELHLQNNKIEVIEDKAMEGLPNLRHLNIKKNFLNIFSSILNSHDSQIQYLQLDGNAISDVRRDGLTGLRTLEVLRLNDNNISRISRHLFDSTSRLKNLYLNNNSLSEMEDESFSSLKKLWYLNLKDNRIKQITRKTFSGLSSLRELYLSNNNIVEIESNSFSLLPSLEILHISGEESLSINHEALPDQSIRELSIENSPLLVIGRKSFGKMTALTRMTVSDVHSIHVDSDLIGLESLRSVHLVRSRLTFDQFISTDRSRIIDLSVENCSLTELRQDLMNSMASLRTLSLRFNGLSDLPDEGIRNIHSLRELDLESNNFSRVPHASLGSQLHLLSIASNRLKSLDADSFGRKDLILTNLNISHNAVRVIREGVFRMLKNLEKLDLSFNAIHTIAIDAFDGLVNLTEVILGHNRLMYLSNALFNPSLTSLSFVDVKDNPIDRIRENMDIFGDLVSLDQLVISRTNLSILTSHDFVGFSKVTRMILAHNKVSRISPGAFGSLRFLQQLDLSNNQLEIVPSERLSGLFNLVSLNLSGNNLQRLSKFGKNHQQLVELDISYNQLEKLFSWNFSPLVQLKLINAQHNVISWIHKDTFKNLTSLKELDISGNKLTNLEGGFLDYIESSLRVLKIKDNPFECDCSFSTSWMWIRYHRKLVEKQDIVCSSPTRFQGRSVWSHNLDYLCAMPLISELEIQPLRHDQLTVQWRVRNQSKVRGVKVLYHSSSSEHPAQISSGVLKPPKTQYNIQHLRPSTWYTVCIVAMANEAPPRLIKGSSKDVKSDRKSTGSVERCVKIKTPDKDIGSGTNWTSLAIILGCTLGVVIILGVSITLTVVKFYKMRQNRKRRPPKNDVPQEYLSYRHFSLQSIERMFEET